MRFRFRSGRSGGGVGPVGGRGLGSEISRVVFGAVLAFAQLVLLLFLVGVYLLPILLLFGIPYFEYRAKRTSTNAALSPEEVERLSSFNEAHGALTHQMAEIDEDGKSKNLKTTIDGMFHSGSKLGMELNEKREKLEKEKENLERDDRDIRLKKFNAKIKWIRVNSSQFALRWTAAAYLMIGSLVWLIYPARIQGISNLILFRITRVSGAFYDAVLTATLLCALFLPLLFIIHHRVLWKQQKMALMYQPESKKV